MYGRAGAAYHAAVMRLLVDLIWMLVAVFAAPVLAYRSWRTGKYRTDWDQRRGFVPPLAPPDPRRPRVWVHAVSVGEMNAVRGLAQAWQQRSPHTEIVISCTTDTGIARARELFPQLTVFRYPLDLSWFVTRAFDRIRPSGVVLVELEVWFNFVTLARARGIPVAIVNGRLSEKSVRWFSRVGPIARRMFGSLAWVGAQDEAYAGRFVRMGVPAERVSVTGSLKWETAQIADTIPGAEELARAMGIESRGSVDTKTPENGRHLFACGSTGPGEEEVLLRAYQRIKTFFPRMQLVLVPRKPERFDEVAQLVERAGYTCIRRSRCPDGSSPPATPNTIFLVDTMGELRKVYSLASVVFVGRSLVPMGGSDMMEVAALGKPTIVGRHTGNFRDAMQQLRGADAIVEVGTAGTNADVAAELADAVTRLLTPEGAAMGARAREVVRKNLGATQRTLDRLIPLVEHSASA